MWSHPYHLTSWLRVGNCKSLKPTSTQEHIEGNTFPEIVISQNATPESFGLLLYTFRNRLGITQRDAASRCNISRAYYSALENSKRPPPPPRRVSKFGIALGVSRREQIHLHEAANTERLAHKGIPAARRDIQGLIQHLLVHGSSLAPSLIKDLLQRVSTHTCLRQGSDTQPVTTVSADSTANGSGSKREGHTPYSVTSRLKSVCGPGTRQT